MQFTMIAVSKFSVMGSLRHAQDIENSIETKNAVSVSHRLKM